MIKYTLYILFPLIATNNSALSTQESIHKTPTMTTDLIDQVIDLLADAIWGLIMPVLY